MTAKECRRYAEECLGLATTASSDQEREAFLEIAKTWLRAARLTEPENTTRQKVDMN